MNAEKRYKVVFRGDLEKGISPAIVKRRLKGLCKNEGTVDKFFNKKTTIIRSDITLAEAQHYKNTFDGTGAVCYIEEIASVTVKSKERAEVDSDNPFVPPPKKKSVKSPKPVFIKSREKIAREKKPIYDQSLPEGYILFSNFIKKIQLIGTGRLTDVFQAELKSVLGATEIVALKTIKKERMLNLYTKDIVQIFKNKLVPLLNTMAPLKGHPYISSNNVVDYLPLKSEQNELVILSDYISGIDLEKFINQHHLSVDNLIKKTAIEIPKPIFGSIMYQVADALDFAHQQECVSQQSLVHGAISPGNIILSQDFGLIKVTDFGLSYFLDTFVEKKNHKIIVSDNIRYMSPEVFNKKQPLPASDIYSFGVCLYELLTGLCPNKLPSTKVVSHKEYKESVNQMYKSELLPPHKISLGVDEDLSEIIHSMMHSENSMRIESAKKIKDYAWQVLCHGEEETSNDLFSQYLLKMQLLENSDENVEKLAKKLNYEMKSIQLYPDVLEKLEKGENPCRI